ncbi:MAG: acyl-CoA dehydrogenase family protein [Promethearchaeota archaeon]
MKEIKNAIRLISCRHYKGVDLETYFNEIMETFDMVLNLTSNIADWIEPYAREINQEGMKLENGKLTMHPKAQEAIKKIEEAELYGLTVSPKYDGPGLPIPMAVSIIERMSRADAGLALPICISQFIIDAIKNFGTEHAKETLLPEFARGKRSPVINLSEANAGSDLGSVQAKIIDEGDHLLVNGQKIWASNAGLGNTCLFLGRSEKKHGSKGLTLLVIDAKNNDGIKIERLEEKMGLHSSPTGVMTFENVEVPREYVLGEKNKGFPVILRCLNGSRIGIAAQAVGIADAAYRKTLEYTKQRKAFGSLLAGISAIRHILAEMKTQIVTGRSVYLHAAALQSHGFPFSTESACAKLYCGEMANKVCYDAIQLHGGNGYVPEFDVERYYRDARVTTIYEGTSQIQKVIISNNEIKGLNF